MHILDQLMKCAVRIEANLSSGGKATGSGFAYRLAVKDDGMHLPAIITNKHVIEGAISVSFPISTADASGVPTGKYEVITYPITRQNVIMHPSSEVDLCAILAGPVYAYLKEKGQLPTLVHLDKTIIATEQDFANFLPLEEVTMIGFPNGIWDSMNNGSIARRGVIATIPGDNYLGKPQFVVDMACFPGSSGSPIFIANFGNYADRSGTVNIGTRIKLLGILYAGPQHTASGEIVLAPIPTNNRPTALTSMPNNLGYVIKSTEIAAMDEIAVRMLN